MKSESTFSMYPMQSRSQPQLLGARQTNKYKNISAQILNSRSSEMTLKLFLGISGFSLSRLLFTEYIAICRCPIPMILLMSPYTTKDRSPKLFSIKREMLILLIKFELHRICRSTIFECVKENWYTISGLDCLSSWDLFFWLHCL